MATTLSQRMGVVGALQVLGGRAGEVGCRSTGRASGHLLRGRRDA